MRPRRLLPQARWAVAATAAALLCGCASRAPRNAPSKDAETSLFADSTSWLNGAREDCATTDGVRTAIPNPALRPVDPWIGAVGLKTGVDKEYEVGVGLCVPTPSGTDLAVAASDLLRTRQLAVGVWVKVDF